MKNPNLKPIGEHSYTYEEGFTILADKPEVVYRQVDWEKVKELIESGEYDQIDVGLAEDWNMTSAEIYEEGEVFIFENTRAGFYGYSRWATPAVKLYKDGESKLFECWVEGEEARFPKWLIDLDEGESIEDEYEDENEDLDEGGED